MFLARFFGVWRASRREEIAARRVPASRRDEIAPLRADSRRDAPRRARRPVKSWEPRQIVVRGSAPSQGKEWSNGRRVNLSSL